VKQLSRLASRFVNCPLMIHPPKLEVLVQALGPRLGIAPLGDLKIAEPFATAYLEAADDTAYRVIDGIAVIPIQGVLTKKESWISALSGCSSYERIGGYLQDAVNDAAVRAILLQVDSPGGETTGCLELSDSIYSLRSAKPIWAVADDFAFSAAYALTSAADRIFVTRMGAVGSVGVVVLHVEDSKFNDEQGFKYTYIFAGDKKVDANPHEPLSERAGKDIQSEVDRQYEQFVATVARNRGVDPEQIVATQAGIFFGEGAVPLLADEVGTFEDAFMALRRTTGEPAHVSTAAIAAIFKERKVTAMPDEKLPVAAEGAKPDDGDDDDDNDNDTEPKFCHACGTELKEGARFCHACGAKVEDESDQPESAPPLTGRSAAPSGPLKVRPEADIEAIAALCRMAGQPERTAEFLTRKNRAGAYFSVAEVSEALTAARVAESEKHMIHSHVNPNAGSGGVQELEAQAAALARQNRSQITPGLYVSGTATKVTKERAYAQMLEEHPEAYAAFRAQHNAQALIATLEAAGVRLR
jgi:signal peptide peptidase SppA